MRNILFVPTVAETAWVDGILPGLSPAELPIAGRRLIDYATEYAQRFGVILTEILDWRYADALAKHFSDMTRTGFAVFYQKGEGQIPEGLNDLPKQSSPLTWNIADGLVVVWGASLAMHNPEDVTLEEITPEECAKTPVGMYRRRAGKWMRIKPACCPVSDVKVWHELNMKVLNSPDKFTLPGYSAENGVYLGRNVVLEYGTEVKSPVIMQDNSWCARNVLLKGNVIVGAGSFIDEGAVLERTVIGANTYVGKGVELVDKIVIGSRVIDAHTGVWTDVTDPGLARSIGGFGLGWIKSLWNFLLGASRSRSR